MEKDYFDHGGGGGEGGGKHLSKTFFFLFSICRIAKTEFSTHIFNWYLSNGV